MKNKALIRALTIILLAFAAGWALFKLLSPNPAPEELPGLNSRAYPYRNGSSVVNRPAQGFGYIVKMLDLSREQAEAFAQNERIYREETSYLISRIDSLDKAIINELTRDRPDEARLNELARESGSVQTALKDNTIEHFMVLREICTPEQLKKYKIFLEDLNEFRQQRGPGYGRGRGRGYGRRWGQPN